MDGEPTLDDKLAPDNFVADFVWAARAILSQPSVALVSIALWCLPSVLFLRTGQSQKPLVLVVALVLALFGIGWFGVERMFFLRRRQGEKVTLRGLLASAPSFVGRFLRLGFLVGVVVFPAILIVGSLVSRFDAAAPHVSPAAATRILLMAIMVPVDLGLTFVTSALTFSTRSAREALRIGLTMIRQTWPRSGLYVLCPPLALNMVNSIYPTNIPAVSVATTAGLALLSLLAKGATAAFYLRERPVTADVVADMA